MRMSRLFVQTWREAPADAHTPGYQFLIRGGFIRPLAGGPAFLPLGAALRARVEGTLGRALAELGGQAVALPPPRRDDAPFVPVLELAAGVIRSHRQLPALLYEARQAEGETERIAGGLLGARAGRVIEAYGLHRVAADLAAGYTQARARLAATLAGWRPDLVEVIAAEDEAGRAIAHRLFLPVADGAQSILRCPACGYAADPAAARISAQLPPAEPAGPRQEVATPNCKTIAELAAFLGVPAAVTAKAVFLMARWADGTERFVLAIVRGDTALHEARLRVALRAESLAPATEAEIRQAGAEPGYGSAVGLTGVTVVVDRLAAGSPNLVAGANRPGYHLLNVNHGRDYQATLVADIAAAQSGSPCPACAAGLTVEPGVTLAEFRQIGPSPARAQGVSFLAADGRAQPLTLATYRIYSDRTLAALAERCCDRNGLVWPADLAPFLVYLMTVGKAGPETAAIAARLYAELTAAGISVLFDDRDERAGVKFNDADLVGAPLRIAVGERGLQAGCVEVKARTAAEAQLAPLAQLTALALAALERPAVASPDAKMPGAAPSV